MPAAETPSPAKTPVPPTTSLRISTVLEALRKDEGGYSKLEQAIKDAIGRGSHPVAIGEAEPKFVERRKLKAIVENDPKLVLSLGELLALDMYLEPHGHGLAYYPLLQKPELMLQLAESGQITFLLGSRPDRNDDFRINISHWDFLGLNSIQAKVRDCTQKKVSIDIREVRMHRTEEGEQDRIPLSDEHLNRPFDDDGPSIVCLASSRSNLMAERMLCRMSNYPEFNARLPKSGFELPFEFVWAQKQDYVLPSLFHLSPAVAAREEPAFAAAEPGEPASDGSEQKRGASGFRTAEGYLVDELTTGDKREGYTYALCAAQMRERGKIWLLVAGLTGPATYAAASWVHQMATNLDYTTSGKPSGVFWNIVRAHASRVTEPNRDTYQVGEAEFVEGGVAWE